MAALSSAEQATLRTLAATFVPGADAPRVAAIAEEALTRAVDPAQLTQLRLFLRLIEQPLANLATGAGLAGFGAMDPTRRERLLLAWAGSRLPLRRAAANAYRKLLTFIAYADPGTAAAPNPLLPALEYAPDDPPIARDVAAIKPLEVDRTSGGAGPVELESDVVVVGSGAGGGVMAAELARAGRRVLVVEAGPFVDETTMPRNELDAYGSLYLNYGLNATWDGAITLLAGSAVGGGTLVNWMTCLPAPADVRDEWARDHGVDGIDGAEWASDLAAIEEELGVTPAAFVPAKDELLRRGAAELGWEAALIRRNATGCGDCGSCGFGCRRGTKQSGIRAHLAEAVSHGAQVLDRARVRSIVLTGDAPGRVTGVAGTLAPPNDEPAHAEPRWFSVYAPQVVLAAGALRSPSILQATGMEHPEIGRHLRIHPAAIVGAITDEPLDMWRGTIQAIRCLEFGRDEPDHRRYVIESGAGHPGLLALVAPWEGAAEHAGLMSMARRFCPLIGVTRDGGEGRTTLTRAGRVRIDYELDDPGRATLAHALVSMARLGRAGGAREVIAMAMPSLRHRVEGDDEAARFRSFEAALQHVDFSPHRGTVASAHQMGTVRIGDDPALHPADPRGRLRADARGRVVGGLYVADGSTFPTGLGVNPMLTIMAIARRVSRTVLSEVRAGSGL